MKIIIFKLFLLFSVTIGTYISAVEPWYQSNNYAYRLTITNDAPAFGSALTDYPLLVQISNSSLHLFTAAKSDGLDLVFTGSDKITKLDHEIEFFTNGILTAWVKIPSLNPSAAVLLYCYYGHTAAADQQSRTAVWDADHLAVLHFSSNWGADNINTFDSTINNLTCNIEAAPTGVTNFLGPAGKNAGIQSNIPATTRYRIVYNAIFDTLTNTPSVEFLINMPAPPQKSQVNLWNLGNIGLNTFAVYFYPDYRNIVYGTQVSPGGGWSARSATFYYSNNISQWMHWAWTYNTNQGGQLYINGEPFGARTGGGRALSNAPACNLRLFEGLTHFFDEFRLSKVERSASWIKANYLYTASNSAYLVPGTYHSSNGNVYLTVSNASSAISVDNNFTLSSFSPRGTHTNIKLVFADGTSTNITNTNTLINLAKKYFTVGTKTNWMLSAFDNGAVISNSAVVQISEYELPKLDMYFVPKDPYVGQPVVFIANSSARYGAITNWCIDFGSGSKYIWRQYMTNHPVTYHYPYSGEFAVSFSVVDEYGFSNSFVLTNTVTDFGARDVTKMQQRIFKYGRDFPVYFKYRLTGEARKVQLRVIHMNGMILRNLGFKEGFEDTDLLFSWDGKTQWDTYLTHPPCFLRYDVYSEDGFIETVIQIMIVY